jgi:uncharacterized membrane protein
MTDLVNRTRAMRIVVTASLALNLFLAGFLLSQQAWRFRQSEVSAASAVTEISSITMAFARLLNALPASDAEILRREYLSRRAEIGAHQKDYLAYVSLARAEIAQTPLDITKVHHAIETARNERHKLGPILEEVLLAALPQMSEEGRKIFAEYHIQ